MKLALHNMTFLYFSFHLKQLTDKNIEVFVVLQKRNKFHECMNEIIFGNAFDILLINSMNLSI